MKKSGDIFLWVLFSFWLVITAGFVLGKVLAPAEAAAEDTSARTIQRLMQAQEQSARSLQEISNSLREIVRKVK